MKRKHDLYNDIWKYENILKVTKDVLKTNRNKVKSLDFSKSLYSNTYEIKSKLENKNYEFSKYRIFVIKDPKHRIIMSEILSDKIVNHLVSRYILLPSIEKCCIDTNVATRIGKGSSYAFDCFCKYVNKIGVDKKIYVLKIDISKYFYNIDHKILYIKLKKRIKDPDALEIISKILNTTNYDYINKRIMFLVQKEVDRTKNLNISLLEKRNLLDELNSIPLYHVNKGLPIGNMTSQLLAIFYLNDVDHYIKENLRIKYYIRYMDDLIILDTDKDKLFDYFYKIKRKIEENKLIVNNKSNIYELSNGVSFLGYTFKNKYNTLWIRYNNQTIRRIYRKLKKYKINNYNLYYRSKNSYKGYLFQSNTGLYYKRIRTESRGCKMYDKYLELKKDFDKSIVFIKVGKFYRTYDEDAILVSYLFDYRIIDNKVGFPIEGLFKVKSKLRNKEINFILVDGNEIFNENMDSNNYELVFGCANEKYEKDMKVEELLNAVKLRLENDNDFYDNLLKLVNEDN